MSLNIGNVMKVVEDGKWIKVPAKSGTFHLKIKQVLPGEWYAFNKKRKALDADDIKRTALTYETIASHILDWKGLLQADNSEIIFDRELFKNQTFMNSLMGFTVEDGRYLSEWLAAAMNRSDVFAEDEDPDFLASI